jgi:hypothetical protein
MYLRTYGRTYVRMYVRLYVERSDHTSWRSHYFKAQQPRDIIYHAGATALRVPLSSQEVGGFQWSTTLVSDLPETDGDEYEYVRTYVRTYVRMLRYVRMYSFCRIA